MFPFKIVGLIHSGSLLALCILANKRGPTATLSPRDYILLKYMPVIIKGGVGSKKKLLGNEKVLGEQRWVEKNCVATVVE